MQDNADHPESLLARLSQLPDHRAARGKRHPLSAVLALMCCATIAGAKGVRAIAQWGRQHQAGIGPLLGFTRKPPCHSNFHYFLKDLDVAKFEAVISAWLQETSGNGAVVAIDGKTLRGSRKGEVPGVHLLSAFAADNAVLAQLPVGSKTNEAKAVLELLKLIPLKDKVVTMDAAFTYKEICEQILEGEGDYVVQVKDNQPTLKENIRLAFEPGFSPLALGTPAA